MPSKELIEELGEQLFFADWGDHAKHLVYPKEHYEEMAQAAISTILASLQEPTEGMTANGYVHCYNPARTWSAMLNASALGEQSE
ncbi:hypothetical protein OHI65_06915 [Brucella sp. MAB-22]|uniref:hypothetical protein n=1 Tax=Brucella sp. MAB-22 TaxID=2986424 RepID=UPI0022210B5F|nr:hypothetical protein [Brucella sp. MAB-22]UYT54104.1 hypothetical protein OHI65_06915 [Brucella sp. MAB-22]